MRRVNVRRWMCAAILWCALVPLGRAEVLRTLGLSLFVSGVGVKASSVFLKKDAEETYDAYLRTAVRSELESLRAEADRKRLQGRLLSSAGDGMLVLGAFLTAVSLLRNSEAPAEEGRASEPAPSLRLGARADGWQLLLNRPF